MRNCLPRFIAAIAFSTVLAPSLSAATTAASQQATQTATPVKYVVVIFDENVSFDHYFGSYPNAANPAGEPPFYPRPNTPAVNGLNRTMLENNPNGIAPFRLDRSQNVTCDNDNAYTAEQMAYHGGLMNMFALLSATGSGCTMNLNFGYYDGNTVTAIWNYAQYFTLNDNFFAPVFGTTVMGHLNLTAGQTHGATPQNVAGKVVNGTVIGEINPTNDDCTSGTTIVMSGPSIGDLLNAKGITWGWFYGDWTPAGVDQGKAICTSGYDPHYAPFQYYASTANPHHLPPTSISTIGQTDRANHQYSISDFWAAAANGNIPAVTFLKAPHTMNGHPATSSPLAEQTFLVDTINQLQQLPQWPQMAILLTWDDSDGWYDHVMPPIVNQSSDPANDALLGPELCGNAAAGAYEDRCGYGPRLPFLVLSPFARRNFVDHSLEDMTSILRFIEDNWSLGQIGDQSFDFEAGSILSAFDFTRPGGSQPLILDPDSGEIVSGGK
ncbi:MAG: alkaline phosphatase family protein [Candidatus Korobacteraceae bacterium]